MSITDNFYNKIINNLQTIKKSFYLYNNKKISYSELFQKIKKINFYLKNLKKKRIGLYCDKSEFYYSAVIAIILSGNTFKVKIKQLSFINLETIETFSAPIHKVDIKNLETEIGVTKGASYQNHREFNADLGKFGFYEKNKSMHKRTRRLIKNSTLFKLNSIKYELDVLYSKFTSKTKGIVNSYGSVLMGMTLCWCILLLGMWEKTNVIVNPMLSYESAQSGFGMYTKYWLASFLAIFAISMMIQFSSYLFESYADYKNEDGKREIQDNLSH